ncbi:MAG: HAMP domain-containing histidine kinase [Clostridiales bacterium]|jgi:two-component system phosphate regulon sensor histidine kinase PhoR|nr:HAMP domain-containing histidine kinase [Clostridiales bacterium]
MVFLRIIPPEAWAIITFMLLIAIGVLFRFNLHYKNKTKLTEKSSNELVSNIAHELKTPMTSIIGFVETLQAGAINDTEKALHFLGIIEVESQRLQHLVDATLELSRLDNLDQDTNILPFLFETIVNESIELLEPQAQKDNIKVNTYYKDAKSINVNANRERIKQVLINLLTNAIKYNLPNGKVDITVSSMGKNLMISILNTGKGVAPNQIPRLFERFYRIDDGRTRDSGGTGLGLSIVERIIQLYNGRIWVESIEGESTTFNLVLPIAVN